DESRVVRSGGQPSRHFVGLDAIGERVAEREVVVLRQRAAGGGGRGGDDECHRDEADAGGRLRVATLHLVGGFGGMLRAARRGLATRRYFAKPDLSGAQRKERQVGRDGDDRRARQVVAQAD